MTEGFFRTVTQIINFFYGFTHSYGISIALLTICVMIVTAPLTYKSTKSMVQMQRHQPELRRLQAEYKHDREMLNTKMMEFYQQNGINPVAGCFPILLQMPIFIILYRTLIGLIERGAGTGSALGDSAGRLLVGGQVQGWKLKDQPFKPSHLEPSTELYQVMSNSSKMKFLGMDLSITPIESFKFGLAVAVPFVILVALMFVSQWYQNRQIQGRSSTPMPSQQQMIMKFMPFMLPLFSLNFPAGLAWYYFIQGLCRIGLQAVLTKRIYEPEKERKELAVDGGPSSATVVRKEPTSDRAKAARAKTTNTQSTKPSTQGRSGQPRKSGSPRSRPRQTGK